jgi:hypothetical protein
MENKIFVKPQEQLSKDAINILKANRKPNPQNKKVKNKSLNPFIISVSSRKAEERTVSWIHTYGTSFFSSLIKFFRRLK